MRMYLGQKVVCEPLTLSDNIISNTMQQVRTKPRSGRIEYIHPQRRFVVVAFETDQGVVRESFAPSEIKQFGK